GITFLAAGQGQRPVLVIALDWCRVAPCIAHVGSVPRACCSTRRVVPRAPCSAEMLAPRAS
ncbi:hypothetical protein HAX54_011827, partial [Datura stramonium]|nr:hypothetical protein [Datura stramonium]